jgi:hypothetical protein
MAYSQKKWHQDNPSGSTADPARIAHIKKAMLEIKALADKHAAQGLPTTIGALGEELGFAMHPGWYRAEKNAPHIDGRMRNGKTIQFKVWMSPDRTCDKIYRAADRVIRFLVGKDDVTVAVDMYTADLFTDGGPDHIYLR